MIPTPSLPRGEEDDSVPRCSCDAWRPDGSTSLTMSACGTGEIARQGERSRTTGGRVGETIAIITPSPLERARGGASCKHIRRLRDAAAARIGLGRERCRPRPHIDEEAL